MNQEYELSLWQDRYAADGTKTEERLCILADNNMTSLIRATNIQFKKQINGTKNLSFSIYTHYLDGAIKKENPFWKLIEPERRIKLKWRGDWYDFIVKSVREDTRNHMVSYTCNDLATEELGKNGFNIELNKDLTNATGTIKDLTNQVLAGTEWTYVDSGEKPIEEKEESVYEVSLIINNGSSAQLTTQLTSRLAPASQVKVTIPNKSTILLFYSSTADIQSEYIDNNKTSIDSKVLHTIQYVYAPTYQTDLNSLTVINGDCFESKGYWQVETQNGKKYFSFTSQGKTISLKLLITQDVSSTYRAKRVIDSYKQVYDKGLNRYVYEYNYSNPSKLFGYESIKTNEPVYVKNLINNGEDLTSSTGWTGDEGIQLGIYPPIENIDSDTYGRGYIFFPGGAVIKNSGLTSNRTFLNNGKGLTKNQRFILRMGGCKSSADKDPTGEALTTVNVPTPCFYYNGAQDNTIFDIVEGPRYNNNTTNKYTDADGISYIEWELECKKSISLKNIYANQLQIAFDTTKRRDDATKPVSNTWYCYVQFYQKLVSANGIIQPNEVITDDVVTSRWVYYEEDQLGKTEDEKHYFYETEDEWDAVTHAYSSEYYEMCRTLEVKESNRFNILQSLAKLFSVWCDFIINHNADGTITTKTVSFRKTFGNETGLCFQYGLDLTSLSRTIESNQIVTKTYVKANSNDIAENGFCSIADSELNYPGTTTIFNFDYYISHGILNQKILKDLYKPHGALLDNSKRWYVTENIATQPLGYNDRMHYLNRKAREVAERIAKIENKLIELRAQLEIETNLSRAADVQINGSETEGGLKIQIARGCGTKSDDTLIPLYSYNRIQQLIKDLLPNITPPRTDSAIIAYLENEDNKVNHRIILKRYYTSDDVINYRTQLANLNDQKLKADKKITELNNTIFGLEAKLAEQEAYQGRLIIYANQTEAEFFKRYSAYILEGTWIDEKYYNSDEYYLDGTTIAYDSSRPKISYELGAMRLDALEDFKMRRFELGDICYVQDTDFFGWTDSTHTTPYKEKVLISEVTYNILEPSKDTYKLQNYKSQFDDLFQRIVAQTQSLHFAEGSYAAAARSIAPGEHSFVQDYLQRTITKGSNSLTISKQNSGISWNSEGIVLQSSTNPSIKMRLTPYDISMTQNGSTWVKVLSASGLNVSALEGGFVDTNKILIGNGTNHGFYWDTNGLNAYTTVVEPINRAATESVVDAGKFVRFDHFGIYGKYGNTEFIPTTEQDIWDNAQFGLTWQGFFLKNRDGDSSVEISTKNDIQVIDSRSGSPVTRIRLGRLFDENNELEGYGLRINDISGDSVFESNARGELWLKKMLRITSTDFGDQSEVAIEGSDLEELYGTDGELFFHSGTPKYDIRIGYLPQVKTNIVADGDGDSKYHRTIDINHNFVVWENGSMYAKNGYFNGRIEATSGAIEDYLQLGDSTYLFNANKTTAIPGHENDEPPFRPQGAVFRTQDILFTDDGQMQIGEISVIGSRSTIDATGWSLTPDTALFNNAIISGKISTAVFEMNKVQSVGGSMIFKPSYKITEFEIDDSDNTIVTFTLDQDTFDTTNLLVNSYIYITFDTNYGVGKNYIAGYIDSVDEASASVTTHLIYAESEDFSNKRPIALINFGQTDEIVIGINSNESSVGANGENLIYGRGLTINSIGFSEALVDSDNEALVDSNSTEIYVISLTGTVTIPNLPHLFLGDLQQLNQSFYEMSGYGLYCNNLIAEGKLVSIQAISTPNSFNTGIDTTSTQTLSEEQQATLTSYKMREDGSPIVMWGGAAGDDLTTATFKVTQNGTLLASQALIDGAVISRSTLQGIDIYAARLHPIINDATHENDRAALQICSTKWYDSDTQETTDRGIEFVTENHRASDPYSEIFHINGNGFYDRNNTAFIRITSSNIIMTPAVLRTKQEGSSYIYLYKGEYHIRNSEDTDIYEETFTQNSDSTYSIKGTLAGTSLFTYTNNMITFNPQQLRLQNKVIIEREDGRHGLEYQNTSSGYNLFVY